MSARIIPLPGYQGERERAVAMPEPPNAQLRRAHVRIAQLESSLMDAMRDNLANFNRAREAERLLEELRR